MERLVESQSVSSAVTTQDSEKTSSPVTVVVTPGGQGDSKTSSGQGRTNGTVVFTSPPQVKHVAVSSSPTTQSIASGSVSIVRLTLPGQAVQSVVKPNANQQSVIQTPGGTTLQSVQLSKNVILLNKVATQGSVIHTADGESGVHPIQLIQATKADCDGEAVVGTFISADESRKRREHLARRPSYRKILNDLSSAEAQGAVASLTASDVKEETTVTSGSETSSQESDAGGSTIVVGNTRYHTSTGLLKVVPASTIQLATGPQEGTLTGLQTLTMTNSNSNATGTIVQYAQGQDGQFFVPVTVSAADLQAYQIRTTGSAPPGIAQGVVMSTSNLQPHQHIAEEASRKRELRLLKNREAAKECRRKKKEYIKCLENRVAVLENQNKALIDELKSLKELYCQKAD